MPLPKHEGHEEFEFPDEKEEKASKKATEDKFEIEIEDDTPAEDRGRKPMREPVEEIGRAHV